MPLPGDARWPKFNELEMVTTFTYKSGLVRIDARNFELSLQYTRTQTQNPQTGPITIHCAAASAQSNQTSRVCTVVHYAVLEAIHAVYGIWQI